RWKIDDWSFQQLGDVAGMHGTGAAECKQRQPALIDAAVDRMRARRGGHRLADHAIDA
ncbi:MAG: hypothetical protein QOG38_2304, partial [Hyphomicrobiales bacterium]|nr:hypothetical protein [Hyphomicrobiales bacterium]